MLVCLSLASGNNNIKIELTNSILVHLGLALGPNNNKFELTNSDNVFQYFGSPRHSSEH